MATPSTESTNAKRLLVWEPPVRLFHWTLVILFIALFVSIEVMDNMDRHAQLGYAALALILFRLIWGFVGGTYARFGNFLHGPGKVLRYSKTLPDAEAENIAGHNPLGGWMVIVLLLGLLAQAGLGLFGNDDILFDGPLSNLVSKETSDLFTELHEELFHILLILVGLHIAAVLYHRVRKGENLILAMFTGYKTLPADSDAAPSRGGKSWLAAVLLALCGGAVYLLVS